MSAWQTLSSFDVSEEVKKKGKFDYLSWTWAWAFVKRHYPDATFEKHIFRDNQDNPLPFMRDTKGHTYVAVSVTIDGITHTEIHYVMDHKNQSVVHPDGGQVNKALQRCLVKAIAFHGLGINVYAGEDLPQKEQPVAEVKPEPAAKKPTPKKKEPPSDEPVEDYSKKESAELFRELWTGWIKVEETEDSMKSLYRSNQGTITTIQNHQPEIFEEIKKAFNDRKREIANQNQEGEG